MFGKKESCVLKVDEMHCGHCTARVEAALKEQKGIKSAKADLDKKECEVTFSPDKITPDEMCKLLSDIGFPAEVKNA